MRSGLFAVGILVATAVGVTWPGFGPAPASAQDSGLQFSIAIAGLPGCNTGSGDATCALAAGGTFVVDVSLDALPHNVTKYTGFDIVLASTGVTQQGEPSTDAWPDCAFAAVSPARPEGLLFGCATGFPPNDSSTYTGVVATVTYSCSQSGTIRLVHAGEGATDLGDADGVAYAEADAGETLTVNCVAGGAMPTPPTPAPPKTPPSLPEETAAPPTVQPTATVPVETPPTTATITPTPSAGAAENGGGGVSGGVIAMIVVVAIAGAGVLGFLGWRSLQGRRGPSGDR